MLGCTPPALMLLPACLHASKNISKPQCCQVGVACHLV